MEQGRLFWEVVGNKGALQVGEGRPCRDLAGSPPGRGTPVAEAGRAEGVLCRLSQCTPGQRQRLRLQK